VCKKCWEFVTKHFIETDRATLTRGHTALHSANTDRTENYGTLTKQFNSSNIDDNTRELDV